MYDLYPRKASRSKTLTSEKPRLPNRATKIQFLSRPIREIPFDQLHGFFDCHAVANRHKNVNVVAHNYKIMNTKTPFRNVRSQDIQEERRHPVSLQYRTAAAGSRANKKCTQLLLDVC
jgi:hypothetical protein